MTPRLPKPRADWYVHSDGKFVATLTRQTSAANTFDPLSPWLLLHNNGKIDRFATYGEALNEARSVYPLVHISTT